MIQQLFRGIDNTECDSVLLATPIDQLKLIKINKPATRVRYELQVIGEPKLVDILNNFLKK